ncbi:MAG: bifunctional 4-hydroxy-2-oxoglutarate aldolase/2-dehydro-3-deoxy-phosphogluconate aldolase [Oceanospirillaceae bacterium]|jgi:2-dehydro-3-deoxyphosphogluconate aldolase/(4S)-4-hydroxy-2-oxoglutarate aldolase|nr:bifunctional 4-hydroxy-2-oxoglutarate aldolase/2-dehydro-3-deoxy-phosphogluconate aldolase [Oceanospirillaceae bacterium]MBT4443546.1 bifunctional 4-hydroxy-2-oxoglutarate aldolase/2-dehydro-3-deoxy-phosphogluconate aldolase [Oceanospirillaceae bacterium]MBT6077779.1 bifunctional 4-hydroxy-2-oxoglutarate aldolase/2-dehydro-3-deoxy-phosphogluconate aldolase [Oceanospirillaceae bacterium]MBT7331036.1 bifunctional 4-hydroxy-2-oxoglutarate aldolase/2-dehydro-3-deoxy-phosphogluconate aldolase [Oce
MTSLENTQIDINTKRIDQICAAAPVIPVLTFDNAEQAIGIASALVNGGLSVLEITLRSEYGLTAIKQLKQALPQAIIGAGTVLNPSQYQACIDAGADFIVSPGSTAELLQFGSQSTVPLLPGVASVSEAMQAMQLGYRRFKLFPAAVVGGVDTLKAFAGPLSELKFCPTGGIKPNNAADYLALNNVMCVGGTWLTPKSLTDAKDWHAVHQLALRAAAM